MARFAAPALLWIKNNDRFCLNGKSEAYCAIARLVHTKRLLHHGMDAIYLKYEKEQGTKR